jgi:hypothetical protein
VFLDKTHKKKATFIGSMVTVNLDRVIISTGSGCRF